MMLIIIINSINIYCQSVCNDQLFKIPPYHKFQTFNNHVIVKTLYFQELRKNVPGLFNRSLHYFRKEHYRGCENPDMPLCLYCPPFNFNEVAQDSKNKKGQAYR